MLVMNLKRRSNDILLRSFSYLSDVTTDKLLDLEDSEVVMEANGNLPEDQLDNRRCESNNNSAWVSLLHTLSPLTLVFEGGERQKSSSPFFLLYNSSVSPLSEVNKTSDLHWWMFKNTFFGCDIWAKLLFIAKEKRGSSFSGVFSF